MLQMLQAAWQKYAADSHSAAGAAVQLNFVNKETISRLHAEYFDDPKETDVITFPLPGPVWCGEIYICIEVATEQALVHGITIDEELSRLALHGILHLLGFDDLQPKARRRMRERERYFLKRFSLLTPIKRRRSS